MTLSRRCPSLALAAVTLGLSSSAGAQADSVASGMFTRHDAWMAAGFTVATLAAMPMDRHWAQRLQLPSNQDNRMYRKSASVFRHIADPGTIIVSTGLYLTGSVVELDPVADLGLHATEAILTASAAGLAMKAVVGRALPNPNNFDADHYRLGGGFRRDGKFQAFPSGHTLAAFALASTISAEADRAWPAYSAPVGLISYGTATLCGFSRMYNDAHWASDVIFGAGIGTFSGLKTVWYQHSHPDNWLDRALLRTSLAPASPGRVAIVVDLDQR